MKLFLSTSIFASITPLGAYSSAIFSITGPSALHGPHHSAQKSMMTSFDIDGSTTSLRKASTACLSAGLKPSVAKMRSFSELRVPASRMGARAGRLLFGRSGPNRQVFSKKCKRGVAPFQSRC